MKDKIIKSTTLLAFILILLQTAFAVTKPATVKISSSTVYQKITGFGGFVNSPQFGYNHMTEAEIRKLWGQDSEGGYNIMRLYLPTGEANWPQSLSTAKLAKSLGLKIFASPWSMPTEWKTYNTIAARYTENGVVKNVYLKEENYLDYANYLNNYVTYLKNNGVELDAISIQNEPDWPADYAGCIWTPEQITKFIKEYAPLIKCNVMAPESIGLTDNYANAFLDPAVLSNFQIYAGHQYGGIQTGLKNIQAQGKEVWMTEFLINWNEGQTTARDFNWTTDAFSFAGKLNDALLSNVNAWVHYASKRYYAMMGDGTNGSTAGVMTKRGYILSHYAKNVTGATRIGTTFTDESGILKGSSYLSEDGKKVILMVINSSTDSYDLTVDLPFYSKSGKVIATTETTNMAETAISLAEETARPKMTIGASSITTIVFDKSNDREQSLMTSELVHFDKIEKQVVTNSAFGTAYQLSGKTVNFIGGTPLISTNTNSSNGYLQLNEKYNRLVFHIDNVTSSNLYTSSNTTLYYINDAGAVRSYNYGSVNFDKRTNFDWVMDISSNTLTDGCKGIIGITSGNGVSRLTITLGDVYFAFGNEKGSKFTGIYSKGDSNLMDTYEDASYTSLDFTSATAIPTDANWNAVSPNKNRIYYTASGVLSDKTNVISGSNTPKLELVDGSGNFYAPTDFTATTASYNCSLNGNKMLVLPFQATIPAGVKAFNLALSNSEISGTKITNATIPANTPVLIRGYGNFTFEGSGAVSSPRGVKVGIVNGVYISSTAPIGSYYMKIVGDQVNFQRVTSADQPMINAFGAYLSPGSSVTATSLSLKLDDATLPVSLISFNAKIEGNAVRLNWNTATETNNWGFEIERSAEGNNFEKIGFVSGKGSSVSINSYSYDDKAPLTGKNYYRLKQVDTDGVFEYSEVRVVTNDLFAAAADVYPVPAENVLNVRSTKQGGTLVIYDVSGNVKVKTVLHQSEVNPIDVSHLPSGVYFYQLNNRKGSFVKK